MCPEFYQIQGKVQDDNIDYENELGYRKNWWFGVKTTKKAGKLGAKFA